VLTRSIATTACTLMPIIALLIFGGGGVLGDFAFALLIGVASGAYSSIFIASPVLTHWKEREPQYRSRRHRIEGALGQVPAYADSGGDVEPAARKLRRPGRITTPEPETVSAAEFEQMKRDLEVEPEAPARPTSTLTKAPPKRKPKPQPKPAEAAEAKPAGDGAAKTPDGEAGPPAPAPDVAENEGVAPVQKPRGASKSRSRSRRHGRRR